MPETICLATYTTCIATFKGVGDTLGGNCRHVDDDQPGNSTLNRRWSWTVLGWEFHRFLLLVLVGTRIPLSIWLSYITKESWSHQVGIPPFSGFTGCMHAPLNQTLLHCKSLEVIRWEFHRSLVLLVVRMPLSIWLSYIARVLKSSGGSLYPSVVVLVHAYPSQPYCPTWQKVFLSRTVETRVYPSRPWYVILQDNRLLETTGSTLLLLWWYTSLSLSLSLNFTLLQDQSCGQFQVGTPPLSLL